MCECTYHVYTKGSNFRLVVRPNPRRSQIDVALLPKEKMRGRKRGLGIHKNKTRTSELRIRPPSRVSWPSSKTQLRESSFARRELATMSPERPAYVCVCNEAIRTRRIQFANRKTNWTLDMSHTYPHLHIECPIRLHIECPIGLHIECPHLPPPTIAISNDMFVPQLPTASAGEADVPEKPEDTARGEVSNSVTRKQCDVNLTRRLRHGFVMADRSVIYCSI